MQHCLLSGSLRTTFLKVMSLMLKMMFFSEISGLFRPTIGINRKPNEKLQLKQQAFRLLRYCR